jgi:N-acetylglucosamine-6-phosphate deacetylase
MIFRGGRLILRDAMQAGGAVRVAAGKIIEVTRDELAPQTGEEVVDLEGGVLAPGFIDLHIHGALRRDTMEADPEAFRTICRFHASGGTTALALTTLTAERDDILAVLRAVQTFRAQPPDGAAVLGVHIEGPYFSREKPGAHRPHLIRDPEPAEYNAFLEYRDVITQMTIAPELPGALALIDRLAQSGIRASGGHSDAWDEEANAAFAHGLRQVTHTFNCMSCARRRGPFRVAGLLEFAMGEPEILCELIADGRHVFPTLLRMLYRAKGADGIALITDAAPGAGLPEGPTFGLGEIECLVRDEVGMTADGRALAGSTATMIRCVRNMVELAGVPLVEAVQMASFNPARALGLEKQKGTIAAGSDADLVILDDHLEVRRTFVGGRAVAYS